MQRSKIERHSVVRREFCHGSCGLYGETVILSTRGGEYFHLDAIGAEIWSLLEAAGSVACSCEKFRKIFSSCRSAAAKIFSLFWKVFPQPGSFMSEPEFS